MGGWEGILLVYLLNIISCINPALRQKNGITSFARLSSRKSENARTEVVCVILTQSFCTCALVQF